MPRSTFLRLVGVLAALALGLTLGACGGSDDGADRADATVPETTQIRTQPETARARAPTVTTPPQTATAPAPPPETAPAQPPADTGGATDPSDADDDAAAPARTTPQDTGGATAPPASEDTGGASGPTGCGSVANGFLTGVQAEGAACGEATSVANAWLGSVGESGPTADVEAAGYACSGARSGDATAVTCVAGDGRRVTFTAHN